MQVVSLRPNGRDKKFAYEFVSELDAIGNGDWVLIPEDVNLIAVTLEITDGSRAKTEATTDSIENIKADVAVGLDWDIGSTYVSQQDICRGASAIRLVQISTGSSKMSVRTS